MGKYKYKTLKNGDILKVSDKSKFYIACCDCGLVHSWQIQITNNSILSLKERKVVLKVNRENRRTAQKRRWLIKSGILKIFKKINKRQMELKI